MTTDELARKFNDEFGMNPWPKSYQVDEETYKNVLLSAFENRVNYAINLRVSISIGIDGGVMFKNVELLVKK